MNKIKLMTLSIIILTTLMLSPVATGINFLGSKLSNTSKIQKLLVEEANRQGVEPALALAIAEVESNFNPRALSSAGAKGVMQIMPATAESVFGISSERLYDAKTNISMGISFIKKLLNRYDQRLEIALSHYNGGSAVRDKFGRLSVIPATRKYVNKVISAQHKFIDKIGKNIQYQQSQYKSITPVPKSLLPVTESIAKSVIKPEKHYSSVTFNDSQYQKMEHLRSLRLHNIMRNTKSKSANKNKIISRHVTEPKKTRTPRVIKNEITLSEKRKKVLKWEAMFNE